MQILKTFATTQNQGIGFQFFPFILCRIFSFQIFLSYSTLFLKLPCTKQYKNLHNRKIVKWWLNNTWLKCDGKLKELENQSIVFILSSMTCSYFYEDFRAKSHLNNKPLFLRKGEVSSIYVVLKIKVDCLLITIYDSSTWFWWN